MKLGKVIFAVILVLFIGGFGFFAVIDIPVTQQAVSKEVPHERVFDE